MGDNTCDLWLIDFVYFFPQLQPRLEVPQGGESVADTGAPV